MVLLGDSLGNKVGAILSIGWADETEVGGSLGAVGGVELGKSLGPIDGKKVEKNSEMVMV